MTGELIALTVAVSWTATALFTEDASRHLGALSANIMRMVLSMIFLGAFLWIVTGRPWPTHANAGTWLWLAASGLVGYAFGDTCLYNCYLQIGSRFGQLLMTLSSVFAALAGFLLIGEKLSWTVLIAMAVTLSGIAISVTEKSDGDKIGLKLPLKGILLGIGAAAGQGVGLVLSKQGLLCYSQSIGDDATMMLMAPFAGTFIRSVFGLISFGAIAILQKKTSEVRRAATNKKGMKAITLATVFGSFIGVSLSLMAVQHTSTGIAQTIMALTPVFILLPARIFYKQRISAMEIAGAVISVTGVSMFFILP